MFTRNDVVRALIHLGLPTGKFNHVRAKMDEVESTSEIITQQVAQLLDKLEQLERLLNETAATPNFALIKADVLTYDIKGKTYGILSEMLRVSQRIARLLDIEGDFSLINEQLELVGAPGKTTIMGRTTRS